MSRSIAKLHLKVEQTRKDKLLGKEETVTITMWKKKSYSVIVSQHWHVLYVIQQINPSLLFCGCEIVVKMWCHATFRSKLFDVKYFYNYSTCFAIIPIGWDFFNGQSQFWKYAIGKKKKYHKNSKETEMIAAANNLLSISSCTTAMCAPVT